MDRYAISFLEKILRIYSPSRRELNISNFIADTMEKEFGFQKVNIDGAYNVTGEIGNGRPRILLAGHMDTVPGRLPVRIDGDRIHGRGAADAKSSLAGMLIAGSRSSNDLQGTIIAAAVSDEEGSGQGIRELIKRGVDADYVIFGEPSGVDNITIGYKGRVAFNLRCKTASVHASAPWMSVNAIEKAFEVWGTIQDYIKKNENEHDRYHSISGCLTKVRGGTSHNVLPSECELTVDIRVPPHLSSSMVLDEIGAVINKYRTDVSFPDLELEVSDQTEPFQTDKNSTLIRALVVSILQVRKKRPMLLYKTGTGDMNLLGPALNSPVITYGPGNPHLSHTNKESIEIPEFLQAIEIYSKLVSNLVRMHGK